MKIRPLSEVVCDLGEGPIWDPANSRVLWTDITQSTFYSADLESGDTRSFKVAQMIGALALTSDNRLIAATQNGFAYMDTNGGFHQIQSFLDSDMRMNDGKVDSKGRFWAGSMSLSFEEGKGNLYTLNQDNSYRKILENINLSNGMAWSPDNKYFYYIDSIPGILTRYDFDERSGEISSPKPLIVFDTSVGIPDGMTITKDGLLVIALWDGHRVEIYSPEGLKLEEIPLEISRPTSCTFAGKNLDILVVTSASQGIDLNHEPLAGKVLAVSDSGLSGLTSYLYG